MRQLLIALFALALSATLAAEASAPPVGVVTSVSGKVSLYTAGKELGKDLALGKQLYAGDRLKTGANGRISLVLTDGTQLKVNYNTDITLRDKDSKGKSTGRGIGSIKMVLGDLWAKVTKKNSRLEFDTPAAVAAVKGTEPIIGVTQDGTTCVRLRDGQVLLTNEQEGSVTLDPNQQICIAKHQKLTPKMVQDFDAKAATFEKEFAQATSANVKIEFTDDKGEAKTVTLNYGAQPTPTPVPTPTKK